MFKNISLNHDNVKRKKRNEFSVINQANQFDYGKPDWQQNWTTSKIEEQNIKNVICILLFMTN
jgi:hypothetical protein